MKECFVKDRVERFHSTVHWGLSRVLEHLDSLKQWHYFIILSVTLFSKLPLLFNTFLGHLFPEGIIIILSLFMVCVHMCTWACVCFPFITLVSHFLCPAWWRAELREDSTTWPWLSVCVFFIGNATHSPGWLKIHELAKYFFKPLDTRKDFSGLWKLPFCRVDLWHQM